MPHHTKFKRDIVKNCIWYNPQTKFCLPNLNQNLEIAGHRECKLLNERNKITSKCQHQLVYSPARYDTKEWDEVRLKGTTTL